MIRTMVAAIAFAILLPAALLAEDVRVHVIDSPQPTTRPDAPTDAPPPAVRPSAPPTPEEWSSRPQTTLIKTGDYLLDKALGLPGLSLTAEQIKALDAQLAQTADANAKLTSANLADQASLREQLNAQIAKARADGSRNPYAEPEVRAITEKCDERGRRYAADMAANRALTLQRINPLLTPEQARTLKESLEDLTGAPEGVARKFAGHWLNLIVGPVKLSQEQEAKVRGLLFEHFLKFRRDEEELNESVQPLFKRIRQAGDHVEPADKKAADEYRRRHTELWRAARLKAREVVDSVLPDDQRQEVAAATRKRQEETGKRVVEYILRRYEVSKLPDDRRAEADRLAEAARKAIATIDWEEPGDVTAVARKFEADLQELFKAK
ncbi:MAG: hypothetical protein BIFFINMI_03771 [Phycisphaerae bacterium]|nr:hypothetical protein [Phycisphaerae bacterium]